MNNNYFAITPTGNRPEGLSLLGDYLNAQTFSKRLIWVVVDDCDPVTRIPKMRDEIEVISVRPSWRWEAGMNTQVACMRVGLLRVPARATLLILEDDDLYLPAYISTMVAALEEHELVGERDSRYYNITTGRCRVISGAEHASLASTACRGRALARLKGLCASPLKTRLDITLWRHFNGPKRLLSTHNVVGIKGLPGRPGIGVGHRSNFGDVDRGDTFQRWVGECANNYERFRSAA